MSKKAWSVIITVTVIATIFSFGSMLVTRPNSSLGFYADKVFEEAKARQEKPLVSVNEPLKTDVEEMKEEDVMAKKVADILSSDKDFIDTIAKNVTQDVEENLSSWADNYKKEVNTSVESTGDRYIADVKKLIDGIDSTIRDYIDGKLNEQNNKITAIDSDVDTLRDNIKDMSQSTTLAIDEGNTKLSSTIKSSVDSAIDYTDKKNEETNTRIDTLSNETKAYVDNLVIQIEDYINQRIAEIPASTTFVATPDINIVRTMPLLSSNVIVDAHSGYARFSFPIFVTSDDIDYGIKLFSDKYPELSEYVTFAHGGNLLVATYSSTFTESDISYGLDLIEDLLSSFVSVETKVEEKPVVEKTVSPTAIEIKPEETVVEETPSTPVVEATDSYDFHIEKEIPFNNNTVRIDAYKDNASFRFNAMSQDELSDLIVILLEEYPSETSNFTFTVDDSTISILYDKEYSRIEVESYLDFLISFYSSRLTSTIEVEEIEEKPVEVAWLHIQREIPIYTSSAVVDAYSNSATIVFPEFVTEDDLLSGVVYLLSAYPNETKNFTFSVGGNSVAIAFDRDYSEDELNMLIDSLEDIITAYINGLKKKGTTPKTPVINVEVKESITPSVPTVAVDTNKSITPEPPKVVIKNHVLPSPQENIEEADIPKVRDSIRNIEVEKYLSLFE